VASKGDRAHITGRDTMLGVGSSSDKLSECPHTTSSKCRHDMRRTVALPGDHRQAIRNSFHLIAQGGDTRANRISLSGFRERCYLVIPTSHI
jgi:hypothetical protein